MLLPLTFLLLLAPFPSFQASISERKNFTKPKPHAINLNVTMPVTSIVNVKAKPQNPPTTSKLSNASQILHSATKPGVAISIQKTSKDKVSSSSPITIVISEGCFQSEPQKDATNTSKVKETEVTLKSDSPLVMTHHISMDSSSCSGGCEVEMATLKERLALLEKEMSTLKKKCILCSKDQCPNNCSGQGKCEMGKCLCHQGFSGPNCSSAPCPSNCNRKGKCMNGKCMCQTGFTGPDCKGVDKKVKVTVETVTHIVSPEADKADKIIFMKETDFKEQKADKKVKTTSKDNTSKLAIKPSIVKIQHNDTSKSEVLLEQGGKRSEQATKGETTYIKVESEKEIQIDSKVQIGTKQESRGKFGVKKENHKDPSLNKNITQNTEKKPKGTLKLLDILPNVNGTISTEKDRKVLNVNMTPVIKSGSTGKKMVESSADVTTIYRKDKKLQRHNGTTVLKDATFDKKKMEKHVNVTVSDKKLHPLNVTEESSGKKKVESKRNLTTSMKDKLQQGNETAFHKEITFAKKKVASENDKLFHSNGTFFKEVREKYANVTMLTVKEKKVQQRNVPYVKDGKLTKANVNSHLNAITSSDEKDKRSVHRNVTKTLEKVSTGKKKVESTMNTTGFIGKAKTVLQFSDTAVLQESTGQKKPAVKKHRKHHQSNITTVLTEPTKKKVNNADEINTETTSVTDKATKSSGIQSVEVQNITATGFVIKWEAPQGVFKSFTVTRREVVAKSKSEVDAEEKEKSHDSDLKAGVEVQSVNRTSTKVQDGKVDRSLKKFTQVLAGFSRSYHFRNLQPQTRYSVSLFGSGPSVRSKVHHLFVSTGPEAPIELQFSNITETSLTVSWTKPKSTVTGFKVTYTTSEKEEIGSMAVDSQLSHVLISKLSAGSSYEISVRSVLETMESDPTTASVTTVPDPPVNLQAVNVIDTRALLKWKPAQAKVDHYILTYGSSKSHNETVTVMLSGNSVEHQLRGLHRSTLYTVKIMSQINSLQSSSISTTFSTTSGVKLQAVTPTEVTFNSAVIAWKTPRLAFRSYRLTYQLGQEIKEVILNPTVPRYELTDLVASSNYTVKVEGESEGQYISVASASFTTAQLPYPHPSDCSQVQHNGIRRSGEAEIYLEGKDGEPVWVYCDMETDGGGWTVFQRRVDGSTDFFKGWNDYSKGFGNLSGEFWLGNDILHTLTSLAPMNLRIDLRSGNNTAYAHYSNFTVGPEANHYTIGISGYSGTAGDSMRYHNGRPFSTKDKDPNPLSIHCAKEYKGGWWYKNCYKANLNGIYGIFSENQGVVWIDWKGKDFSLPYTEMKLRPSSWSHITPPAQG